MTNISVVPYDELRDIGYPTFANLLAVNMFMLPLTLFGIGANVLVMTVFCKQGFSDTINISLFSLAFSDINILLTLGFYCSFMHPWYLEIHFPFDPEDVGYLAGWVLVTWVFNSSWLAAFISLERSISIVKPLQVKQIITPKVTVVVIASILLLCIGSVMPLLGTMRLSPAFHSKTNRTIYKLHFVNLDPRVALFVYVLIVFMQLSSFFCLFVSTMVLIISFRRKAEWRKSASLSVSENADRNIQQRDKRVVKMVILICCVILACFTPGVVLNAVSIVQPEFDIQRKLELIHVITWTYAFLPYSANSSINIVIYCNTSSRFRVHLLSLIWKKSKRDS